MSQLDELGRCCGRKPIFYKGGNWRSPPQAPMHFCTRCSREYGPDGQQRANHSWAKCVECGSWVGGFHGSRRVALCGECACEDDCAP
jgi:hypothetical protein